MTIYTVYFSFILFVIFLLLINSYFLISLKIEKNKKLKIRQRKDEIRKNLIAIFEDKNSNHQEEIKALKSCFERKVDIQAFYLAVKEYFQISPENRQEVRSLLEEIVDIEKILNSGIVRREYKRSYALYLISEFALGDEKSGQFALDSLDKNSIYIRNNALNVINKNRDVKIFIKALEKIDKSKYYFNEKMIVDFLDNYSIDKKELDTKLYLQMDNYGPKVKKTIITHFTNMSYKDEAIRVKNLEFLRKNDEKEMIIASTKYFDQVIDKRAKEYLLKNIKHEDWAIRAVSAKIIYKYDGPEIKEVLKEGLKDPNYYVRFNSASSFLKIETKQNIIEEALTNKDRFARDILLYCMNTKGLIDVDEYEILKEEARKNKAIEGAALI